MAREDVVKRRDPKVDEENRGMDRMYRILSQLYKKRFSEKERIVKNEIWKVLCSQVFQKYINKDAAVLDIGAGFGEFINNMKCKKKYAIDINEDCCSFLEPGVNFFKSPASDLSFLENNSVNLVFISNVAEHLKTREDVIKTFEETKRVLKPGGRVIMMGPNIKYLYKVYWDFFDHYVPVSHKAMVELLLALDFKIKRVVGKFMPFTTKSRLPKWPICVWMYLKFPPIWTIMGRQMLIVAEKQ